jgi:hypothetical protein
MAMIRSQAGRAARRPIGDGRGLWFVWALLIATISATGSVAIW